jgi:hypothetical protein
MRQALPRKHASETEETEKVPVSVVKGIREAILDEVFQPGDRLAEVDLAEKFQVSRSRRLQPRVDNYIVISTYVRLGSSAKISISSSSVMQSGWTVATRME